MVANVTAVMVMEIALLMALGTATAAAETFHGGADISMLPEIEKAGGVYRDDGKEADAIAAMRARGCNLFRVRLFVDPDPDFHKTDGATQDLNYVRALAKRIKAAGATFMLDIHYSDRWADPAHQDTPRAWRDLDFDTLERKVHEYTTSVLKDLAEAGVAPDMVQVGNEIAAGMLWPLGRIGKAKTPEEDQAQWARLARLISAGSRAVREASTAEHPIRVVVHIHGGGKPGLPKWFCEKLHANPIDYDILALSFYPAWGESLDALKQNMQEVIAGWGKDILVAETSYPWKEMEGIKDRSKMAWPMTPDGQAQFLRDLIAAIKSAPNNKGVGFVWWYPEAIPVKSLRIWRNGAEGVFDEQGRPLPALKAFSVSE